MQAKQIAFIGLLLSPLVGVGAYLNQYVEQAKFFQFSELQTNSPAFKKMVTDARMTTLEETYLWFVPIPLFLSAFIILRRKEND